jgi:parvulin-like peptidyl-prolyl isomerase
LIGPISREELSSDLQAGLDKMKVGDLTEVIHTPRGYQILKLESRSETKIKSVRGRTRRHQQ